MNDIPGAILADLANPDPAVRLGAVGALRGLPVSPAALHVLGRLAANDPDPAVRSAAVEGLRGEDAQSAYASQAVPRETRMALIQQVAGWQTAGHINREQAEVLLLRYGFDLKPGLLSDSLRWQLGELIRRWTEQGLVNPDQAAILSASLGSSPAAPRQVSTSSAAPEVQGRKRETAAKMPAAEMPMEITPEEPKVSAPSLSQILFSETSIRIALFLGGFLVIAAALILAALVEVARLPVLLGLAALSGTGALISRRRLPLPSFVLYIIFASSLPILARVLVDLMRLTGTSSDAYWSAAWLLLAFALAVGTRLYASRMMSFAALGGLVAAGYEVASLLGSDWRALGLMLALVAVIGVLGSAALQRWKDFRFALPLYLGTHLVALAAMVFTAMRILADLIDAPSSSIQSHPANWLYFALAWAAAASFYLLADRFVRRFAPLPYLSAGAMIFFPWTFAQAFTPGPLPMAALIAACGALYAMGGAALDQRLRKPAWLTRYGSPLMLDSPVLFSWAALTGLEEDVLPGLFLLLIAAAVLTMLNVFRQRLWAWSGALLFGLLAYFAFFELDFVEELNLSGAYIALLPGLLLLVPEFLPFSAEANRRWRVPARWLGVAVLGLLAFVILMVSVDGDPSEQREGAVIYALTAIFFLALALRRGLPLLALVTAVFLPPGLVMLLSSVKAEHFLPWLGSLAVIYYGAGWAALRGGRLAWSRVFRFSALGLGLLLLIILPFEHDWLAGLSVLAAGALFLFELLRGPRSKLTPWLQIPLDAVLAAALFGLLDPVARQEKSLAWALGLLLSALIVLGFDLFFSRAAARRPLSGPSALRWALRTAGILLAGLSLAYNIAAVDLPAGWAAGIFAVSAVYALLAARIYPLPRLGYALIGYLALALFYLLRALDLEIWLGPEIALAVLFYAGSFVMSKKTAEELSPWIEVLRYGGLALALLVSLTAPLEDSGLWASLWVACAATLFAMEAFRRRSVWWGFPTDGLYLLAYFLLLLELHVDQAQFFSIAVAALGMLQHYLLIRTGSSAAAFITGMVSQLVLLGTTYYQMVVTEELGYFVILFFQGLAVLAYGIVLRSRSLVITPLVFIVLGVMTVVLSILSGVPTAIIIGCTGILLLTLGILAVVLRERLVEASEKMGGWRA